MSNLTYSDTMLRAQHDEYGITTAIPPDDWLPATPANVVRGCIARVVSSVGLWLGRREDDPERWRLRWLVVGGYLLLTLALFAFFHPVYVADTIPYEQWRWRMWFPSWI